MRFIPTAIHGILDYTVAVVLMAAPWLLQFADNGPATWTPVTLGVVVILYSLMTNYEAGLFPVIPMSAHLMLDAMGGIFLAASPWLFGFDEHIWWPHLFVGLSEVMAAMSTQLVPRGTPRTIPNTTDAMMR